MFFSRNLLEKIKKNLSIIKIIGKHITLKKVGNNYSSLCPFHNDQHPSLFVSEEKKIFKCFVCEKKGDVFSFLVNFKKISFFEAVKQLAEEAGLIKEIENLISENKSLKFSKEENEIFEINNEIKDFFHFQLLNENTNEDSSISLFLKKRKIDEKITDFFQLGYATTNLEELARFLLEKDYSQELILKTGIFKVQNGLLKTIFFKRVIFPIFDFENNVVSFSGRVIENQNTSDKIFSKYINIYEKNTLNKKLFYGLNAIQNNENEVFVVEGFMDVISLRKINCSSIGLMGLNLTEVQQDFLKSNFFLKKKLFLFLDNDDQGSKKTFDLCQNFLSVEIKNFEVIDVKGIFTEKDPDEMISSQKLKSKEEILKFTIKPTEFIFKKLLEKYPEFEKNFDSLSKIIKKIKEIFSNKVSYLEISFFLKKLSSLTKFPLSEIENFFNSLEVKEKFKNFEFIREKKIKSSDLDVIIKELETRIVEYIKNNPAEKTFLLSCLNLASDTTNNLLKIEFVSELNKEVEVHSYKEILRNVFLTPILEKFRLLLVRWANLKKKKQISVIKKKIFEHKSNYDWVLMSEKIRKINIQVKNFLDCLNKYIK